MKTTRELEHVPVPGTAAPAGVAVVVLNWNGYEDTVACLDALLADSDENVRVHCVDNASANDEAERLEQRFGARVQVHRNEANLGFTRGNNTAIERILAEGACDHIALLNNDTVVEPGWLDALVRAARAHPEAGLFASRMVFFDEPGTIENAGIALVSSFDAVPRGRGRPRADFDEPARVVGACGGAVLYRSRMLEEIGVLREDFFLNFEDVELSLRAAACGWQCRYVPTAVVRHRLNRSIQKARDEAFLVRSQRNVAWACLVNLPWQVCVLDLPWVCLRDLCAVVAAPLVGQCTLARVVSKGRLRLLREARSIWRARRALRAKRRGGWLWLWWRQQNVLPLAARAFHEVVWRRRRRFFEAAPAKT